MNKLPELICFNSGNFYTHAGGSWEGQLHYFNMGSRVQTPPPASFLPRRRFIPAQSITADGRLINTVQEDFL